MVLGGDDNIAHAGPFGNVYPGGGIKLAGVEPGCQFFVLRQRDLQLIHDPLTNFDGAAAIPFAGGQGVESPVDKHAEARVAPPGHARLARFGRLSQVVGRRSGRLCRLAADEQHYHQHTASGK